MLILDRYALDLANERNAPQYRLEEACSALGVKTLKNSVASYRHAARCPRGEGALKVGRTRDGPGASVRRTALWQKTQDEEREADRRATRDVLRDPARDTPGETPPAQLRLHDPARRAVPTRRVQRAVVRLRKLDPPIRPRPLPHQAHVLRAHRVVGRPHKLVWLERQTGEPFREVTPRPSETSQRI